MLDHALAVHIVEVIADLDQAGVGLDAAHVVVPDLIADLDDAVELFGLGRIGNHRRIGHHRRVGNHRRILNDQLAGLVEGVVAVGHIAVGLVHPVGAALDHGAAAVEVVVILTHLHHAGVLIDIAVFDHVGVALIVIEAGVVLHPPAVLAEGEVVDLAVGVEPLLQAGDEVAATEDVGLLAVQVQPLILQPLAGPAVTGAVGIGDQLTPGQNVVGEGVGVAADGLFTIHSSTGGGIEVVVIGLAAGGHSLPAGLAHAVHGVVQVAVQPDQAGDVTGEHTPIVKAVEAHDSGICLTGNTLGTGDRLVVLIVVQLIIVGVPALTVGAIQHDAVAEGGISIGEVAALLRVAADDHIVIDKGIQVVLLLVYLQNGERIQLVGTQVNVIGHRAGVDDLKLIVLVPCSVSLRLGLQAAEDADGVGGDRIDGRILIHPLAGNGQGVGFLIQLGFLQRKVFVGEGQVGNIHFQILVNLGGDLNGGQNADTLCQLQQVVPCSGVGAAGEHTGQVHELIGDLNGFHIQTEGVAQAHILIGIHDLEHVLFPVLAVENLTEPGEGQVTVGGVFKVENSFIHPVGLQGGHGHDTEIAHQSGTDHHSAVSRLLNQRKLQTVDGTGIGILQNHQHIVGIKGNGVAAVGCLQGQLGGNAVDHADGALGNVQRIGHHHMEHLAAHHVAVHRQRNGDVTQSGSGEHIAADSTDGAVGNLPLGILGNLGSVAGDADAHGGQINGGARGQIVILGGDGGMMELIGHHSGGHNHQRGADASLVAVGGAVNQSELVAALSLGQEGGGAAAVQIDGGDTAGIDHDLSQFLIAAAAGEGLLTTVQHHQDHLTASGNAHAGTGGSGGHMGIHIGSGGLAVDDQEGAAADGFLKLILVLLIIGAVADDGGTVLQNAEEAFAVDGVVGHALHHQCAGGLTGGHIEEVTVNAQNGVIVFDVMLRILRVGVTLLRRHHLVMDRSHGPALSGIVGVVVGVDAHVISAQLHLGDVVSHLLIIGGVGILDGLGHAGGDLRFGGGENGVVAVGTVTFQTALCQLVQIVGESVAAGYTQGLVVGGDAVFGIQHLDAQIGIISIKDRLADILTGLQTVKAAVQEEDGAVIIGPVLSEPALHGGTEAQTGTESGNQIVGIQVAVDIQLTEAGNAVLIDTQIVGTDIGDGGIQRGIIAGAALLGEVQQVAQVTGPAAQIGVVGVIVAHVHGAEHMLKLYQLSVGRGEHLQIAQRRGSGAVGCILSCHVCGKSGVFRTCHGLPGAGGILGNTGTDIVEYQSLGVGTDGGGIAVCVAFQHLQVLHEAAEIRNRGLRCHCRNNQTHAQAQHQQCRHEPLKLTCFHVPVSFINILHFIFSIMKLICSCME